MSWNKIKRYSGMSFGRPAIVGSSQINRTIRSFKRRNPPSAWKTMFGLGGGPTGRLRTRLGKRRGSTLPKRRRVRRRLIRRRGKVSKSGLLYRSILKHGLTQPAIELDTDHGSLAQIGNNLQAYCQWYGFQLETTPAIYDRILTAASNAAIGSVNINQEVFFESCKNSVTFRNAGNHSCVVQVFKCYPRVDYLVYAGHTVGGLNPTLLQSGFTDTTTEAKATSAIAYNDWNATPYMSPAWCGIFKMKPVMKRVLQPGEQTMIRHSKKLLRKITKTQMGVGGASSFASLYEHMRRNGPVYLVKVYGDLSHDHSLITTPMTSATDLHVTRGGFQVDWVKTTKFEYRAPFVTPTRVQGYYTKLPQNILAVNEKQMTTDVPQEAFMSA